jgi:signal peptidase II
MKMTVRQKWLLLVLGSFGCLISDQLLKHEVRVLLTLKPRIVFSSFFSLVSAWNPGISWGLFPFQSRGAQLLFLGFLMGCIGVLGMCYWKEERKSARVALMIIIGGALSNALDRVMFGAVYDFLSFHSGSWYFPVFNLADMLVTIGFLVLMKDLFQWNSLKNRKKSP